MTTRDEPLTDEPTQPEIEEISDDLIGEPGETLPGAVHAPDSEPSETSLASSGVALRRPASEPESRPVPKPERAPEPSPQPQRRDPSVPVARLTPAKPMAKQTPSPRPEPRRSTPAPAAADPSLGRLDE
ncbi:MAG TPA: hypothetical protein VLT61_06160, partial [Anaeromyxobacteraceae bacterium]|nr:hypothetical protein [Anaeromyxobacteraceae bacterium]